MGDGAGTETTDPKLQYLKNLMIKYLGTDEGEAREHMERAIATVLQFSEEVRVAFRGWKGMGERRGGRGGGETRGRLECIH